jgi:hypothetical protein
MKEWCPSKQKFFNELIAMRYYLIVAMLILGVCRCGSKQLDLLQYQNGRQVLNLNGLKRNGEPLPEPEIGILLPDSVKVGDELVAKIFLQEEDVQLVDAYYACQSVENPTVDTLIETSNMVKRLDGCTKRLMVSHDTIRIGFRPSKPGVRTFEQITILTRDKERVFRTQAFTFDYKVVEN